MEAFAAAALTKEGLEVGLGAMHVGHWYLTALLGDMLLKPADEVRNSTPHVPPTHMCPSHTCAPHTHVPLTHMCPSHTCAPHTHVPHACALRCQFFG
jgi:hypothetical protein